MKINQMIYNCKTGKMSIEEVVVDEVEELPVLPQEPTLEERVAELERINLEQSKMIQQLLLLNGIKEN